MISSRVKVKVVSLKDEILGNLIWTDITPRSLEDHHTSKEEQAFWPHIIFCPEENYNWGQTSSYVVKIFVHNKKA